jgi:hypothetical protein
MPLSKDQKWTVGTGIAVVLAVLVIVIIFQPHIPDNSGASAAATPTASAAPSVSPTAAASPVTVEPTPTSLYSTPAPAGQ